MTQMLANYVLSHQGRFRPTFIKDVSPSVPLDSTADHLASDADPRTPTLRRFSKLNMSTTSRAQPTTLPTVKIELVSTEEDAFIRDLSTTDLSVANNNWLLVERAPELQSSTLGRRHWSMDTSEEASNGWASKFRPVSKMVDHFHGSLRNRHTSAGNLKLVRNGLGATKTVDIDNNKSCCHCVVKSDSANSLNAAKLLQYTGKVRASILPTYQDKSENNVDRKKYVSTFDTLITRSPTSTSNSSTDSSHVNANGTCHQSCPDLLEPCMNRDSSSDSLLSSTLSRNRKKKLHKKSLKDWTLDDVLGWLHSADLDEVTSVLIGYEITGSDVDTWTDSDLLSLGISDRDKRQHVLDEVHKLKLSMACQNNSSVVSQRKYAAQRCHSLFSLIQQTKYDKVLTFELPTPTSARDFTVATDSSEWALVVTSAKPSLPLVKGDLIIEINGVSCVKMAPVDFNKILIEPHSVKFQLVVLRKLNHSTDSLLNEVQIRL